MAKKSKIEDWEDLLNWDAILRGKKMTKTKVEDQLAKILGLRKIPIIGTIRNPKAMPQRYIAKTFADYGLVDAHRKIEQTETFMGYNLLDGFHFPGLSMFNYVFKTTPGNFGDRHQLVHIPLHKRGKETKINYTK